METPYPVVTIIIAVRNGAATLRRCLESIVAQTYPRKEVIVLDGASTDGTQEILRSFNSDISYWRSEPDKGIYDAWNRGLAVATGDWICFIGADDYYADPAALAAMMEPASRPALDFISARCTVVDAKGAPVKDFGLRWDWARERRRHYICHPGSLHRRSLFDRYGQFDTEYRVCGDYDFNLRAGNRLRVAYVDRIAVCVGGGGVCRDNTLAAIREMHAIQARHPHIGRLRAAATRLAIEIEYRVYRFLTRLGVDRTIRSLLMRLGLLRR